MKTIKFILFIGISLCFLSMYAQNQYLENEIEQAQTNSLAQKIIGIWVAEEDNWDYRNIYETNGTFIQYWGEDPTDVYQWQINTSTTESGVIVSELTIINVLDSSDRFDYFIDTLNDERMILVYQNGGHISRTLFFKQ